MRQLAPEAERGFTLPEVLIALALLGVIASLLVNAIGSTRLAHQALDHEAAGAAVPAAQAVLRRLLREIRPLPEARQPADPDRAFVGERNGMSFVSSFVPRGQFGGLWHYDLALDGDTTAGAAGRLVIAQRLLRPASATSPRPPSLRTVLIAGVLDLRLRYFGVRDQEQAPQWHDSWRQADRLPQLIAIDVAFASKDQRQWLTLITAPMLGP